MLQASYPIQTARLTLRPFCPDDLDDLYAIHSLPEVARYLYWEPRDMAEVRDVLDAKCRQSSLAQAGDRLSLAVLWREVGKVVGEVSLVWLSEEHRQGEVGFVFHPRYQGKGLAREAAAEMLRIGFADMRLHRIIGRCDARNAASARLMERLGMRREAHFLHNEIFKGAWGDEYVYALLDAEWADLHGDGPTVGRP